MRWQSGGMRFTLALSGVATDIAQVRSGKMCDRDSWQTPRGRSALDLRTLSSDERGGGGQHAAGIR